MNTKLSTLSKKAELNAEQDKVMKPLTLFFGDDGFHNMFVYQPALDTLKLKKYKETGYVISWRSKAVNFSEIKPLYTAFLHSIKLFRYEIGIKFDKERLATKQNNYLTKVVNAWIVYYLDACSKNPANSFKLKISLLGETNVMKSSDNEKWVYSRCRTVFDGGVT